MTARATISQATMQRAIRAAEACGNALRRSLANACRQKGTMGWVSTKL